MSKQPACTCDIRSAPIPGAASPVCPTHGKKAEMSAQVHVEHGPRPKRDRVELGFPCPSCRTELLVSWKPEPLTKAAPALLEALEDIDAFTDSHGGIPEEQILRAIRQMARAAIREAKPDA